ncbi:hypothetical protein E2C01_079169 [Portunus trituberculatus]|uniref:Uncharacterized protein n=1 Tax=Portunus trituberculatus TaxID=210409 RepID=A0A5B7IG94_PORTR|nr:hypothetical protein [Portunus trituberculatus]
MAGGKVLRSSIERGETFVAHIPEVWRARRQRRRLMRSKTCRGRGEVVRSLGELPTWRKSLWSLRGRGQVVARSYKEAKRS